MDLKKIKLVVSDVDGIMTDGGVFYDENGNITKRFSIYDGQGIKMLLEKGVKVAIISASNSKATYHRFNQLGVNSISIGIKEKLNEYHTILHNMGITSEQSIYVGDDLVDINCMKIAGISITVPNAIKEIKEIADYITKKNGGDGAFREICDLFK
jgi:3-deoxy-D-manno-octulosonate 8-phosphate phosphatase (KDO 8-P phosphatase)